MISIRVSLLVSCLFLPALVACSEDRADPPQRSDASSEERVSGDGPGSKAPPRNSASGDDTVATSPDTSLTDGGISVVDSSDVGETTSLDSMDVSIADPDVTTSGDETADVVTSSEPGTELSATEGSTSGAETSEPPRLVDYLPCDVEVILAARCRVCHSRTSVGEGPLLDTYAQVRAEAPWVVDAVLEDFMPQLPPPLTEAQKATLVDWLEAGTPAVRQMAAPLCVQ